MVSSTVSHFSYSLLLHLNLEPAASQPSSSFEHYFARSPPHCLYAAVVLTGGAQKWSPCVDISCFLTLLSYFGQISQHVVDKCRRM